MSDSTVKPSKQAKTLGVLLVHGIGSERRGDTLVHCTTALHRWVSEWIKHGPISDNDLTVELIDTHIVQSSTDEPAQARLVFRRGNEIDPTTWLLVESSWFDTYRRPGFLEFLEWVVFALPTAVIVHFLSVHQRAYEDFKYSDELLLRSGKEIPAPVLARLKKLIAPELQDPNIDDKEFRKRLQLFNSVAGVRLYSLQVQFVLTGLLALLVEIALLAVAALAIFPGYTRNAAISIQRKLTGTIGDSFLFVASPITEAAISTRVKRDLDWLRSQCDEVVILAHSQGAAVSYGVLERERWGSVPTKPIAALLTYGPGLRKLFDLRHAQTNKKQPWVQFGLAGMAVAAAIAVLFVLYATDRLSGFMLFMGVMLGLLIETAFMSHLEQLKREIPDIDVKWHNFYATHDPVSYGPLDVRAERQDSDWQHEVVNRMSIVADHTSYWSSTDDFVARIARELASASKARLNDELDERWLDVAAQRRRWRVEWLARCRTAAVVMLMIIICLLPRTIYERVASGLESCALIASLPPSSAFWEPCELVGMGVLLTATLSSFFVAACAWTLWDMRERSAFVHRRPFQLSATLLGIFTAGWFATLLAAPLIIWWRGLSDSTLLSVLPFTAVLVGWTIWNYLDLGKYENIGDPTEWGLEALEHGFRELANDNKEEDVRVFTAFACFARARAALDVSRRGSEDWFAAVTAEVQAARRYAQLHPRSQSAFVNLCECAIRDLKTANRESGFAQAYLDEALASSEVNTTPEATTLSDEISVNA